MAYQTPITIKEVIEKIRTQEFVLPSIQREFVWDTSQIEMLFDSLMRDYPISTFLFWKVSRTRVKDFQFYRFIRNYHEKTGSHNQKIDIVHEEEKTAILDGQQRLTSLYLALAGSIARKAPYYKWDSPNAFPKKELYLDLLAPSEESEMQFNFKFLTATEAEDRSDNFWYKCSHILAMADVTEVSEYLMDIGILHSTTYSKEQATFANRTLNKFFNVIHERRPISFFLETSEKLDKVLQIFIRINSGGTKLSYSDLLLSIAAAQWQDKDAREIIHHFVDDINNIHPGFSFDKDNVLKSCLVLADLDVKFHVDNFTKENMMVIERDWHQIANAVKTTVQLLANRGFSRDNLRATNTIIPIAYFIYKNEFEASILQSAARENDRRAISEWLARVLLKGTFGGQPDSIYPKMRDIINNNLGRFPLKEIIAEYSGLRKSISFTEDDIESLLNLQYGKGITHSALSLLYPGFNYSNTFHQDHIHPRTGFNRRKLRKQGFSEEQIEAFNDQFNSLPNLQLLQETQNLEKSGKPFFEWVSERYSSTVERDSYLQQHFIKTDASLELKDFQTFYDDRRAELKRKFKAILGTVTIPKQNET